MVENVVKGGWLHKETAYCAECYELAWVVLGVCEECWKVGGQEHPTLSSKLQTNETVLTEKLFQELLDLMEERTKRRGND